MKSKKLIKTITKWLKEEIAYGQPVVDGQEQLSDGTEEYTKLDGYTGTFTGDELTDYQKEYLDLV